MTARHYTLVIAILFIAFPKAAFADSSSTSVELQWRYFLSRNVFIGRVRDVWPMSGTADDGNLVRYQIVLEVTDTLKGGSWEIFMMHTWVIADDAPVTGSNTGDCIRDYSVGDEYLIFVPFKLLAGSDDHLCADRVRPVVESEVSLLKSLGK